jgi:hypothetical protein
MKELGNCSRWSRRDKNKIIKIRKIARKQLLVFLRKNKWAMEIIAR